jgi:hypothetical protein
MTTIKEFEVCIEGTTMLMNRLSKDLIEEIKKIPKAQYDEYEDKNYLKKLYGYEVDGGKTIVIPEINIHAMLQSSSKKYMVSPPKQFGRTWTNYIKGSVVVSEVKPLEYKDVKPFACMVNGNPSSSGKSSKVYKVRPLISDWRLTFVFQDAAGYLKEDLLQEMLSNAGLMVGFGDWRPQFGRFKVRSIKSREVRI